MVYGIPSDREHRGYIVVFPKQSPRHHEDLQRTAKKIDQQIRDGFTEEGGSLHILGA